MTQQAILFDFDYTLVDSGPAIVYCFNALCEAIGHAPLDADAVVSCIGMPLEDILVKFFPDLDDTQLKALKVQYLDFSKVHSAQMTAFFPDAVASLEKLKSHGFKLGIVSTKFTPRIQEFLDLTGHTHLFDLVVGGDLVSAYKPNPEGIYLAAKTLHTPLEQVRFVGDSPFDLHAAQNAGIPFHAVLNGTTTRTDFIDLGCPEPMIFDSLTALVEELLQIF